MRFLYYLLKNSKERTQILKEGPYFWGIPGLFMRPWFPDLNPASTPITTTLVWVRLLNLPLPLGEEEVMETIGNLLGRYPLYDKRSQDNRIFTYARLCA